MAHTSLWPSVYVACFAGARGKSEQLAQADEEVTMRASVTPRARMLRGKQVEVL